jgi:hypothetical protein
MPPNPFLNLSHALLRTLRRVAMCSVFVSLAIGLPLQALSSTLAGVLGPRHVHQLTPPPPLQDRSADSMAGWTDFRRANYEHRAEAMSMATAGASTHRHAHEDDLRHRHVPDDVDVVDLESPADGDGAPTAAAFALAVETGRLEPLPRLTEDGDEIWRKAIARSFATPFPRRIERPPSSA